MAHSWKNQRLKDLGRNIEKDLELLNEFEQILRYEDNPWIKLAGKYENDSMYDEVLSYIEQTISS